MIQSVLQLTGVWSRGSVPLKHRKEKKLKRIDFKKIKTYCVTTYDYYCIPDLPSSSDGPIYCNQPLGPIVPSTWLLRHQNYHLLAAPFTKTTTSAAPLTKTTTSSHQLLSVFQLNWTITSSSSDRRLVPVAYSWRKLTKGSPGERSDVAVCIGLSQRWVFSRIEQVDHWKKLTFSFNR